jgi:hypothetical protein
MAYVMDVARWMGREATHEYGDGVIAWHFGSDGVGAMEFAERLRIIRRHVKAGFLAALDKWVVWLIPDDHWSFRH